MAGEIEALAKEVARHLEMSARRGRDVGGGLDIMQGLHQYGGNALSRDVVNAHTGTLLHGPGGLFNTPGLDNAVISTHVRARGLGSLLQAFPSNDTNPMFGLLTGISDDQGGEPTYPCDDAPSGYIKSGTLTARFGVVSRDTENIEITQTITKINRGDFTDLMLVGSLLNDENRGIGYPTNLNQANILNLVVQAEQLQTGVRMERKLNKMLWTGNVAVKTLGGYAEFPGLESQLVTGQVDAEISGKALPSADTTIINVNYQTVGSAFDVVAPIEEAEDFAFNLAMDTGMDPADFVVAVRPQLWRVLTSVWPIAYNTQPDMAVIAGSNARVMIDARTNVQERDAMRAGLYIDINGRRYNVVIDHGIPEENSASNPGLGMGEFASSFNFIPLSAGGMPVTYWQYLNYADINAQAAGLPANLINWSTDGGRFLWSQDGKFTCFKLKMTTAPRVVVRTPHLGFRVIRLKYARQNAPLRDPHPDSNYWVNGGVSTPGRSPAGPTAYAAWL
jgi:hypothetical protein